MDPAKTPPNSCFFSSVAFFNHLMCLCFSDILPDKDLLSLLPVVLGTWVPYLPALRQVRAKTEQVVSV